MATASKAFRARAFDSNRSMTVYWGHELPDLSECSVGNRAVTQMPSGMEKEEEMESHLQDAILAQQASTSGVQVNHVIPTPKVDHVSDERYHSTYHNRNQKRRDKYIKVHAWQALERDEPEYDYDTEDEEWLRDHQHIEPRILEKVFDTVENHSSETVVASEESVINFHKTLDSSIVYEVYEYWVNKRLTAASTSGCVGVGGLIPRVRTECRKDGQGAVNPYVAFRRRAEKMQTRKNRKNDEDSYEKILKLMHDMSKAQQLFDMTARREKQKLALLDVESELLTKRMELSDFGATSVFGEITEKLRAATTSENSKSEQNGPEEVPKKKKRIRKKVGDKDLLSKAWLRKNAECWNRPPSLFGHNGTVPTVTTKPAREGAPDGKFAFRRRRNCGYRAPIVFTPTVSTLPVPATPSASSATAVAKPAEVTPPQSSRFYETFLPDANGAMRSIGLVRRRCGRGGRVLFDRMPRNADEERLSTDPWAEYCVADNSRTFRARQTSLGTEEESDDQSPRSLYFARSDRCRFNDDEREREWASRYQPTDWNDIAEDEPSPVVKKFNGTIPSTSSEPMKQEEKTDNDDNSEVERMDVDGQEDEAQITVTSTKDEDVPEEEDGDDRKNEDDMDVDDKEKDKKPEQNNTIQVEKFRHIMTLKPLQEHSPPLHHSHSGNGRAGREEPTPLPAKMSATVSETEDWREPSGSPSESNSSTEWGMMPYIGQQEHQTAAAVVIAFQQQQQQKKKLMNVVEDEEEGVDDEDHHHHQETKDREHSIKESMSTVTMLENRAAKTYMMPSM